MQTKGLQKRSGAVSALSLSDLLSCCWCCLGRLPLRQVPLILELEQKAIDSYELSRDVWSAYVKSRARSGRAARERRCCSSRSFGGFSDDLILASISAVLEWHRPHCAAL